MSMRRKQARRQARERFATLGSAELGPADFPCPECRSKNRRKLTCEESTLSDFQHADAIRAVGAEHTHLLCLDCGKEGVLGLQVGGRS